MSQLLSVNNLPADMCQVDTKVNKNQLSSGFEPGQRQVWKEMTDQSFSAPNNKTQTKLKCQSCTPTRLAANQG